MVRVQPADFLCQSRPWSKLLPKVQVYAFYLVKSCYHVSVASCTVEGGSGVSRTRTGEVPLEEGVCISAMAAVVHMFVFIVLYAAGHRKECVTEMVRVESADSSLSATAVVKTPPQGTGVCVLAVKSCHHVYVASCTVEGVCIFCCGCSCAYFCIDM